MSKKLESLSKKHDALLSSSKYLKNEKNQRLNEVTFYPYSIRKQHHNTIWSTDNADHFKTGERESLDMTALVTVDCRCSRSHIVWKQTDVNCRKDAVYPKLHEKFELLNIRCESKQYAVIPDASQLCETWKLIQYLSTAIGIRRTCYKHSRRQQLHSHPQFYTQDDSNSREASMLCSHNYPRRNWSWWVFL